MSDFSLLLPLQVPVIPPGYDVQVGGHFLELLALALGIPLALGAIMLVLGMGPTWLKASRAAKGEVSD